MLAWRQMKPSDLDAVFSIASVVHPAFPEDREVLAERLALYPAGCRLLEGPGGPAGYFLSHPWYHEEIPALNQLLGSLPALTDTYYLHDLALLPVARGQGHAAVAVRAANHHAVLKGYARQALVSVNGSEAFWRSQGFEWVNVSALVDTLASYEAQARYMLRLSGGPLNAPPRQSVALRQP